MKKTYLKRLFIIYIALFNLSFSNVRKEGIEKKQIRNQVVYFQSESKPFTGEFFGKGIREQYDNGIKHGSFQGYLDDKEEKLSYEGRYVNGIKHGTWTLRYLNGDIKGVFKYNYDKPSGQWTYFYENKNIEAQENLLDGILDGRVIRYASNGELLARLEYSHGLLNKEATFFHKGEVLESITKFNYGKLDGKIQIFGTDGLLLLEGEYNDNKRDGAWKFFYKTGDVKTIVMYKNGLKDGYMSIFDRAGILAQKTKYVKGDEVDTNGNVVAKNSEFKDSILDRFRKFNRSMKYERYDKILSEME